MPLAYNVLGSVSEYTHLGILNWELVTTITKTIKPNEGYVADNVSQVVFTLPISANIGDRVTIVGKGTGGWAVTQLAGQVIHFGKESSTTGITGGINSAHHRDTVVLMCITANTEWNVETALSSSINIA